MPHDWHFIFLIFVTDSVPQKNAKIFPRSITVSTPSAQHVGTYHLPFIKAIR